MVTHYRANGAEGPLRELAYFGSFASDEETTSEIDGKKLSHQYLIPPRVLEKARRRLRENV